MPDSTDSVPKRPWARRLKQWLIPALILLMAGGIVFLISGKWNTWTSERTVQETDDAYIRADLTPLSTKVAGLIASVSVSDYEPVKAGDLLVRFTSRAGDASRAHRPVLSRPRGPVRRCERRKCGRRKGTDARELTASRTTKDDQTSSLFSVVTYAAHLLDLPVATRNPAYPNPLRRILLWTVLPGMQPTVRGEGVRILIHSRAGNKQQN